MALALFRKNKSDGLALLTGFKTVRQARNQAGGERFGLIELAPEYTADLFPPPPNSKRHAESIGPIFTAALRLHGPGLNRWLAESKDDNAFYTALCQALPDDSPTQFLLQRRRAQLGQHYEAWQNQALSQMRDEEITAFFLQDYLDSLIYPTEDEGLARLWCGLLISGRTEDELADRLARLLASLPCDATICNAAELGALLLDYYAPAFLQDQRDAGQADPDPLYSEWLAEVGFRVGPEWVLADGPYTAENDLPRQQLSAYWTLSAPPLNYEAGWTRRLLENEALRASEFDLTVHLAPAFADLSLREVLVRRLASLEREYAELQTNNRHREATEVGEQKQEVQKRLTALLDPRQRFFEVGVTLALRAGPEDFENECAVFEEELRDCGLAAHRTGTTSQTGAALLDCAPLNLSRFDRPFVLPAAEAGRLAHLGAVGQPDLRPDQPLVGLSPTSEAVYLNPAQRVGEMAFFLVGEEGKSSAQEAKSLTRYLTAMRRLKGGAVCGLDRKGQWARTVQQLGGVYLSIGPEESQFHFNPLEVTAESLAQISNLEIWVGEIGGFLSALLNLDDELKEDLTAVLVESAIARVSRNEELNAASIWIRAETSGYLRLAEELRKLGYSGRYGWLCSRPTRLPAPGRQDLLFVGLSAEVRREWSDEAQRFYFARLFARFAAQIGVQPPQRACLLVVEDAHELLTDPVAARSLGWLAGNAARVGLSLWLLSPRLDEWLNSHPGRTLLEQAQTHLFFNQSGPGLAGFARRMGLSQRFLKAVRETLPGAAVVRQRDEDGQTNLFAFEPLPGDYIERLSSAPAQFAAPAAVSTRRPAPIEVPLFAPDEIFGDDSVVEESKLEEETDLPELDDENQPPFDNPAPPRSYAYA